MADRRVGRAFVEIVAKGFKKVAEDLRALRSNLSRSAGQTQDLQRKTDAAGRSAQAATKRFQQLQSAVNKIGSIAARAFAAVTAGIAGTLRLASPREWDEMSFQIGRLGIALGRIFLPLLREVTSWFQQMANWLQSLSNEQRAQILYWTKIGLGVLLVTWAVSKLIAVGAALLTAFKIVIPLMIAGFRAIKAAIMATFANPWMLIIAGITAAVMAMAGAFSSASAEVRETGRSISELEGLLTHLRQGGGVGREQIRQGMTEEDRAFIMGGANAAERAQRARQRAAELEGRMQNMPAGDPALAARAEAALRAVDRGEGDVGGRNVPARVRRAMALRRAGFSDEQVMTAEVQGLLGSGTGNDPLNNDAIRQIGDIAGRDRSRLEMQGRIESARRFAEQGGRVLEPGDEFRGQVRQQRVEFTSLLEAWKKVQSAQSEDVSTRLQREQLQEAQQANQHLAAIAGRVGNGQRAPQQQFADG